MPLPPCRAEEDDDAQEGPPAPVGIDIKGGAAGEEMRSFEEIMAGTTVVVGVDEQGRACLHLTDDDLAQSTRALSDWIAAQG